MFLSHAAPANAIFNQFVRNVLQTNVEPKAEQKPSFVPAVDVVENAQAFQILLDLPGVDPTSIDISVDKGVLSIKGERVIGLAEGSKINRQERSRGEFLRKFTLPESADTNKINASHAHGVLQIDIAKAEVAAPRRISVAS
jgi:HSP20 family protein